MAQRRRALQVLASFALAASTAGSCAWAQAWPSQPLKIIVPNAPGGTSDIIARIISKPLGDALGVPVIVENRAGAEPRAPRLSRPSPSPSSSRHRRAAPSTWPRG
ncbi:MAG: transporter substrate-binding protein [Polaromonas sp.]|nr:transporter substrate-binding protein [Polaromonas sp.]